MTESPQPNPAEAYERVIVQNVFVPWSADLIGRAAPQQGERVLDVACGSGIVMRQVAPLVGATGKVVGLDINPMMLEVARTKVPADGATVEFREGSGTDMPLDDASFDLVTCEQGLQFFPDHAAGLGEMRRVLAPGGRAVVSCWLGFDRQPFLGELDEIVAKHVAPGAFAPGFSLSDPAALTRLAAEAGFGDVEVHQQSLEIRVEDPQTFVSMMMLGSAAVLPAFASLSQEERLALVASMQGELAEVVGRWLQDGVLVFMSAANVLMARV